MARPVQGGRSGTRGVLITREKGVHERGKDLPARILFVFLDGVGLGEDDPERNPLAAADLPTLVELCGGARPVAGVVRFRTGSSHGVRAIDAGLGIEGRPQSGTGQVALLTGINAAARFGRHFGPWVPTGLRELLASENLFRRAADAGARVAFANAYPADELHVRAGNRRPGAFPFAARAAGVLTRHEEAVRNGSGIVSGITTDLWRRHVDAGAPNTAPEVAGRRLARISATHELTVFAHYDTDFVGHRGGLEDGIAAIEIVDAFLGGIMEELPADTLLVVTSDHGNLEDVTTGHTRNRVPLIAFGPGWQFLAEHVTSISDVTPALLNLLDRRVDAPVRRDGFREPAT